MNGPRVIALLVSTIFVVGCGATELSPLGPSVVANASAMASAISQPAIAAPPAPAPASPGVAPTSVPISGQVDPVSDENPPCWADRYACEAFEFTLAREGTIEVSLSWNGEPRDLMVQLYWSDGMLAHEAVAPRTGPPVISFRRSLMEASRYRLRVVSLAPASAVPFTLTVSY